MLTPNDAGTFFERIVKSFKASPLATLMATVWLVTVSAFGLGGYLIYMNSTDFINRLAPSAKEETEYFHKSIDISNSINQKIESIRRELHASKVLVAEFHNNKRSLAGVPWNFYSVQYAAVAPAVQFDAAASRDVPNAQNAELYTDMWNGKELKCIVRRPEQLVSSMLKMRTENRNTRVFYTCPIQTSSGVPIGWVSVTYNYNNEPQFNDAEILEYLTVLRDSLTPLLENTFGD